MNRWLARVREWLDTGVDLLYPPCCFACGLDSSGPLCPACCRSLPRLLPPFCNRCSQPFPGQVDEPFLCSNCGHRRLRFECAVAPWRATGPIRTLIHRFKYEDARHLRRPLADLLSEGLHDPRLASTRIDALVPVPLHRSRERRRGYNQAALLCETLAERTGHQVLPALLRIRPTLTQTRLHREERMENLRGAFVPDQTVRVKGLHLLVVDDVFTTGATTDACADALRGAGAHSVRVLTVARG